jgi:glyoxylase-like metal-dependent hydrolase (beta-lactamase superfamily II)/rhodanese-related sulfurtransferase
MLLKHFFVEKIAHSSYLLAGSRTCAIVDPERNVDIYLDAARSLGMRITHVIETHLHADFVSGHMDIRERTGAAIIAPRSAECDFDHIGVSGGDSIQIEDVRLDVLETPGHTPEHVCYVVTDTARGDAPVCIFTGDTLFVGDVGRPDLFPGRAHELAGKLYDSIHGKLLELPDYCEVLPAHGAGSLCGRAMGAKWTSTIGYERRFNPSLRIEDRETFIQSLTSDMPPAPDHFGTCTGINAVGPALVGELPRPARLAPLAFRDRGSERGAVVLDVRPYDAYGGQHVPNALSIPLGGNFATFAGWVIPAHARILMVVQSHEQAMEATRWLQRVGLDRVEAYLDGGTDAWSKEGLPAAHTTQLSPEEVHGMVVGRELFTLLDVRASHEYASSHIGGALNVPAPDLRTRHVELDASVPTVVMCSSGNRSSLAASILERNGFDNLRNAAGGYAGYAAAGFGEPCVICSLPHGPRLAEQGVEGGKA